MNGNVLTYPFWPARGRQAFRTHYVRHWTSESPTARPSPVKARLKFSSRLMWRTPWQDGGEVAS